MAVYEHKETWIRRVWFIEGKKHLANPLIQVLMLLSIVKVIQLW